MTTPRTSDVDLVRGLVGIPSVSGDERAAVEFLVARMAERGFRAEIDAAGNAVGEIGDGPRHVVLLGHIDTVPGDIPVHVEDGHLVGRGAVDAKGPLAAFVAAATDPVPGLRVTVVGAVEEESPTSKGARFRATLPAPDWCVVGEPSGWDGITVAYKGRLVVSLELERPARHGAAPGATVADEALDVWARLRAAAEARGGARAFDRLDCRLEGVRAGESDGLVERASLRVGYRVPPGLATAEVAGEIARLAAEHGGDAVVRVEAGAAEEPVRTSRADPLARAFARAVVAAGGEPSFKVKSGTSDMNVLAPAWRCPILAYGPGDSAYDHTPVERLDLDEYRKAIVVLRGALRAGAERIP
ncbi:MAG TPA: [LysW]-lysine hydrolase [Candidatus Limnocylindria bacterium]|nr:[LysW]-lysine hydrolase [Candidatus Limnocylindria bacterium]